MDKKISVDLETLKFIYKRYKIFTIPLFVIFLSIVIFLIVVVPQIKNVFKARQEAKKATGRIEVLKNNLNTLAGLNGEVLDDQARILTYALPLNKDVKSILDSLSRASQKAEVQLGNYEFTVGDVSKEESKGNTTPSIEISLSVEGDQSRINNFIEIMEKTTPLNSIGDISIDKGAAKFKAVFYYKSISPSSYQDIVPSYSLSKSDLSLIKQIQDMNDSTSSFSSESAFINPF